jgi:DNA-directed RNA polymerase subunit RPC12/RpoP
MRLRYEIIFAFACIAFVYFAAQIFRMLYLSKGMKDACPNCGGNYIKTSTPRRVMDLPFKVFRFVAYRCMICDFRFHRRRIQAEQAGQATAIQ